MPSMDVGIEVAFGKEAGGELVLSVDFRYRAGTSDTYDASRGGPGGWDPGDPPELEIETIYWPIQKWDAEKKAWVGDHIEMPYSGLPLNVAEAIEAHIIANYDDSHDYGWED